MANLVEHKKIYVKRKELSTPYVMINRRRHNAVISGSWRIGSSINAVKALTTEETETLLSRHINVSPGNTSFQKAVQDFWNNISVNVPENGIELEVGWRWADEEKAKAVHKMKDGVPAVPENEKYKYGNPLDLANYILYRYLLVKGNVANSPELVDESPTKIKFYLLDKELEAQVEKSKFDKEMEAMEAFVEVISKPEVKNRVAFMLGIPTEGVKQIEIDKALKQIVTETPDVFLGMVDDDLLEEKCLIKAALNKAGSPISSPTYSDVIMHNSEAIAKSIEELAQMFKAKQLEPLKNELKLFIK